MTPEAAHTLENFFSAFTPTSMPLLLLDYDGTLAPFRIDRFQARPWAGVRSLLTRLQQRGRTRMAVITGRPAGEIGAMLGLDPPLEVWGLHGAERLYPDGRRELEEAPPIAWQSLEELRAKLHRDSLGGLFEDKPNAAVMHWRGHAPSTARLIEKRTRQIFEPLAQFARLTLLEFESGLELRVGRDKGGAVQAILDEHATAYGVDFPATYLGDDLTDEAGFRSINRLGQRGLSVLVRRAGRQTDAAVWLRPPAELRAFLQQWLEAENGEPIPPG